MHIFNRYYSAYDLLLLLSDISLAAISTWVLRAIVHLAGVSDASDWFQWTIQAGGIAFIVVLSFYYAELYAIDQTLSVRELILRLINGFGIGCLIIGGTTYFIPQLGFQDIYFVEMFFTALLVFAWRLGFMHALKRARIHAKVLIVGTEAIGRMVAEELCRLKHLGMEVVGFIGYHGQRVTLSYGNPTRVSIPVFPFRSVLELVDTGRVNRILVAGPENCADFPAQELVTLRVRGFRIEDCHSFYERLTSKISITDLQPGWIVLSRGFRKSRWILLTKRAIDIVVSLVGIILASPIALLTAIAIKIDSPGPVVYRQVRVGQNEKPFTLYKFRSMRRDAEAKTGPMWATANDSRVTRTGRILRKLRIDEIPQMVNVLKGEMSFVGPRPERPIFVSWLKEKIPYYCFRFSVKPGITGWAQISYPYGDTEEDAIRKLEYDLYYMKNISLLFDLQIIFESVKVVLSGRGAQ